MADKPAHSSSPNDDALKAIRFLAVKALVFMVAPAVLAVVVALMVLG